MPLRNLSYRIFGTIFFLVFIFAPALRPQNFAPNANDKFRQDEKESGISPFDGTNTKTRSLEACTYAVNVSPQTFLYPGPDTYTGHITVTTQDGCPWEAVSNADWITIADATQHSGSGATDFSAPAPIRLPGPLVGTITVAGQSFTIKIAPCDSYTLADLGTIPASGGTFTPARIFSFPPDDVIPPCGSYTLSTAAFGFPSLFATYEGLGGSSFTVAPNTGAARSQIFAIGFYSASTTSHIAFTINQESGCTYALGSSSADVSQEGFPNVRFNLITGYGCQWTSVSDALWITINTPNGAGGPATLNFAVQPNNSAARSGTISVNGLIFTVNQASGCNYTLSSTDTTLPASAGSGSFNVNSSAGCGWTVQSQDSWITITSGGTGDGTGTVNFNVQANPGSARTGTIIAGGKTFTIHQDTGCSFSISPAAATLPASAGSGNFKITAPPGCSWTATSPAGWVTVSNESGSGNGNVSYSVLQNDSPQRTADINIAGQTFTITQDSGCVFSLSPQNMNVSKTGGSGSFNVNTSDNACSWATSADVPWITIVSGATGSGNGSVIFSVEINTGQNREGSITSGGQTFVVNQAGAPVLLTGGGLVMTGDGRPIRNATVTYTNTSTGEKRIAVTNPFGYVHFKDIEAGQSYSITIHHKRYMFGTYVVSYFTSGVVGIFTGQ